MGDGGDVADDDLLALMIFMGNFLRWLLKLSDSLWNSNGIVPKSPVYRFLAT